MMETIQSLTGRIKRTTQAIHCEVCSREFPRNRKADLQRHMRIHTDEKPYPCLVEGCGKAFRQSSALKNHANCHTKQRPYACDICNMTFFDKPTCNRHKREKHSLESVFQCPYTECGLRMFKRKAVFKQHVVSHHNSTITDEQAAQYRVAEKPKLMPAAEINSVHSTRHPSPSQSASSSTAYSPASNCVPLRNPYATPTPYASSYPQASPQQGQSHSRYTSPVNAMWQGLPYPQVVAPTTSPYMSPGVNGMYDPMTQNGGAFFGMGPGMDNTYSPAMSPQSLSPESSFIDSSGSSSSSMSSGSGSHTGSPRSMSSRAGSSSPPRLAIDPLLCDMPANSYGKVAVPMYTHDYYNNAYYAPALYQ